MALPRCVHPVEGNALGTCNKTEAQHGPATSHAFTLTHVPEPDAGRAEQEEHDRASQPAVEQDAQVYRPDTFARMAYDRPLDAGTFKGEPQRLDGEMREGNPLEGVLEAGPYRVPDPEVTLRTEMPDGTLVEVRVAHPTHDTVKMARTALVAAEYVMGRIAGDTPPVPGEGE